MLTYTVYMITYRVYMIAYRVYMIIYTVHMRKLSEFDRIKLPFSLCSVL